MSPITSSRTGRFGDGLAVALDRHPPTAAATGTCSQVSVGENHTCGISTAGLLSCWGPNGDGQLGAQQVGNGTTTSPQTSPVRVGAATWSSVEVGRGTVCGTQSSGCLYCWGLNDYGELGIGGTAGTPASASSPQAIGAFTTWTNVAVGWGFACALAVTGRRGAGDGKLLAAIPGNDRAGRGSARQSGGDLLKHLVTDLVPMRVVDRFEVVDVGQHQRVVSTARPSAGPAGHPATGGWTAR